MYYVYEWFIIQSGEVIYVGKGTHNRYKVRKHNRLFNDLIKRFECASRIVRSFETEKEAFEYEYERIKELKEKGECVCNIIDGGTGGDTGWWSEERKKQYSEHNVMKSERQRERMSKNNPMKDGRVSAKVAATKRTPIVIGEIEYESIKDAMEDKGVAYATISKWLIQGISDDGELCHYKNATEFSVYHRKNDGQSRPLTYKGKHYNSTKELAIAVGVSQGTAGRWCRNGRDTYGNSCRYDDDDRKIINSTKMKHCPVIVNDVFYESKTAASKALGINTYELTLYLDGKKESTKYICKYGNQKPSQGNPIKVP